MTAPDSAQDTNDARELFDALDRLNDVDVAPVEISNRLPFSIVAALAVLIAALLAITVSEDHKLEQRELDRTASRLAHEVGLHASGTAQALSLLATSPIEGRDASVTLTLANEVLDVHDEILGLAWFDANGRKVDLSLNAKDPSESRADRRRPSSGVSTDRQKANLVIAAPPNEPGFHLDSPSQPDSDANALRFDATRPDGGWLTARIDPARLLARVGRSESEDIGLKLQLRSGETVIAAIELAPGALNLPSQAADARSANTEDDDDVADPVAVAPLPPQITLVLFGTPAGDGWPGNLLQISIAGLGLAAGAALFVLFRSMRQQAHRDRALHAETALRRAMETSLATGLRVTDLDGVIRYVNPAFSRMTGWTAERLLGRGPPYPYWPDGGGPNIERKLRDIRTGKLDAAGVEVQVERPDKSSFDAHMYLSSLVNRDGRQIGWLASMADVTDSKRIRRALLDARERFATVLESLEAAVSVALVAPKAGAPLLLVNRAYRDAFGEDADAHQRLATAASSSTGVAVLDEPSQRWYDVRMRQIAWVDGRAARLQIATDITRHKLTEEIVAQQQQSVQLTARLITMGEMASSLAHELNQPLTAITNYSEGILARMKSGAMPAAELLPALEKTSAQAQRAGNIIRRIREFVKRSEPRMKASIAQRIVEDAVGFAEIELRKRGISIEVLLEPDLPPLYVDALLIEQVLLNVIRNGADAMQSSTDRRITVRVHRLDRAIGAAHGNGMAEISVEDRGTGIDDDVLPRLFQPFFSTKTEGMGMGLNICRSIIEFHHGRLSVENLPPPGQGAITRFTLPLAPPEAVEHLLASQSHNEPMEPLQ